MTKNKETKNKEIYQKRFLRKANNKINYQKGFIGQAAIIAIAAATSVGVITYSTANTNKTMILTQQRAATSNTLDSIQKSLIAEYLENPEGFPLGKPGEEVHPLCPSNANTGSAICGYKIPSSSTALKTDTWGTPIMYCNWIIGATSSTDTSNLTTYLSSLTNNAYNQTSNTSAMNYGYLSPIINNTVQTKINTFNYSIKTSGAIIGQKFNTPVFAVISAGQDKKFQTTCNQILQNYLDNGTGVAVSTNLYSGDDGVRVATVNDVRKGAGGTRYYGDPVNMASISSGTVQITAAVKGETRVDSVSGKTYVYDGTTWKPQGTKVYSKADLGVDPTTDSDCSAQGEGSLARDTNNKMFVCITK
jgi:hypothetical protein